MNPTHINTKNLRIYPIERMSSNTDFPNPAPGAYSVALLQPTAMNRASVSLPQMVLPRAGGIASEQSLTTTTLSNAEELAGTVTIITPPSANGTSLEMAENHSNSSTTTTMHVVDAALVGHNDDEQRRFEGHISVAFGSNAVAAEITKIGGSPLSKEEKLESTFILPTTTTKSTTDTITGLPIANRNLELVKKIVVGHVKPITLSAAGSATLIKTQNLQQQQQQHQQQQQTAQITRKLKIIKKANLKVLPTKQFTATKPMMLTANTFSNINNHSLQRNDANKTFALPLISATASITASAATSVIATASAALPKAYNAATYVATNNILNAAKTPTFNIPYVTTTPVTTSVIAPISNSVTLSFPTPESIASNDVVTLLKSINNNNEKEHQQVMEPIIYNNTAFTATEQESLLESLKTVQHPIVNDDTSLRSKRSKSLNTAVNIEGDDDSSITAERRRSFTACESKASNESPEERHPQQQQHVSTLAALFMENDKIEFCEKSNSNNCTGLDKCEDPGEDVADVELEVHDQEEVTTRECEEQRKEDEVKQDATLQESKAQQEATNENLEKEQNSNEKFVYEEELEQKKTNLNIIRKNNTNCNNNNDNNNKSESPQDNAKYIKNPNPLEPQQQYTKVEKTQQNHSDVEASSLFTNIDVLKMKEEPRADDDNVTGERFNVNDQDEVVQPKIAELAEQSEALDRSLLCDEQIPLTSSSSSSSAASSNTDISSAATTTSNQSQNSNASCSDTNAYSAALSMLSTFNMLAWKERIGSARGTSLRFQLNEFNLLQVHERCPSRYNIHTAYEKPIYEREPSHCVEEAEPPLLYLCRRCNCHGPAAEFLAPEFCSLECLKRDNRKRQRDISGTSSTRRRPRKEAPVAMDISGSEHPILKSFKSNTALEKKIFRWSTYLTGKNGEIAAPVDLFLNPFPTGPNLFQIGMKLEAIDPENCSLFCVCTVTDIQGFRLNLTFDGYDRMYNFWVNADSMDIFPPGWCAKTNRILQPPRGIEASKFNWPAYFAREKTIAAPRQLFTHLNSSPMRNPFKVGMHLEAEDLNDTGKLCVAVVSDVLDDRIRIHFNGWDDCYDYWVDINSPYIHPCGWHEGRQQLIVPPDYENNAFSWPDYLHERRRGSLAPTSIFAARDPIDFRPRMKLEVVDPRNPVLIRPATVVARRGHRIKLHLDNWPQEYCFWLEDDSPDLHPIGWCDATGHDLEPPPGYQTRTAVMPCSIVGCRGIGNAKSNNSNAHYTLDSCPYAPGNWNAKLEKTPRLEDHQIERKITAKAAHLEQQSILNHAKSRNDISRSNRNNDRKHAKTVALKLDEVVEPNNAVRDIRKNSTQAHAINDFPLLQNCVQDVKPPIEIKQECNALTEITTKTVAPSLNSTTEESSSQSSSTATAAAATCTVSTVASSIEMGVANNALPAQLHIAKEYLCDYGPRLQQNYNIWQKHLSNNDDEITKNPLNWTTEDCCAFVDQLLDCSSITCDFRREDIDGAALLALQQSDLTDILGMKLGKAVKLYAHILQLRTLTVAKFNVINMSKKAG